VFERRLHFGGAHRRAHRLEVVEPELRGPIERRRRLPAVQRGHGVALHVAPQAGDAPGDRPVGLPPVGLELLDAQLRLLRDAINQLYHRAPPSSRSCASRTESQARRLRRRPMAPPTRERTPAAARNGSGGRRLEKSTTAYGGRETRPASKRTWSSLPPKRRSSLEMSLRQPPRRKARGTP